LSSIKLSLLSLLALISFNGDAFNKINVVTELFSPFQVVAENGELGGWSTTTVNIVLKQTKLDYEINILPWARAYKTVTSQPNTLIFSLLRTLEREDKFNWLVPLCAVESAFYKMGEDKKVTINSIEDAKAYEIGIERGQAKKDFLIAEGLTKKMTEVSNNDQLRLMMQHGRVDIIIASKSFIDNYNAHQVDVSARLIHVFSISSLNRTLYLASYKATSNALIDQKIIAAYQENKERIQRQCLLS